MKIKIYGERHCGTNYLESLIENNLRAEIVKFRTSWWSLLLLKNIKFDFIQDILWYLQRKETLGWKHGCPPVMAIEKYSSDSLVIITITKNPYSFLHSLYRNPYHIKGKKSSDFSQFLRHPWLTRGRDLCGKRSLDFPLELWNLKNASYVRLKSRLPKIVINITYEQLLENPEKCIHHIASEGNIEYINKGEFKNHQKSTKDSDMTFEDYQKYYLNEEWKKEFSEEDFTFLNGKIDEELMKYFNYPKKSQP